jgi:hypothetical protein
MLLLLWSLLDAPAEVLPPPEPVSQVPLGGVTIRKSGSRKSRYVLPYIEPPEDLQATARAQAAARVAKVHARRRRERDLLCLLH